MKNRNLLETRKFNNNVRIFICSRQCTRSMQKKWNKSLLFVSNISGSETKQKSRHVSYVTDAVLHVSVTVGCLQASFVGKSWRW